MDYMRENIRLEPFQYNVIVDAFKNTFIAGDSLWIFGSRADLAKRGGDIDLYIETQIVEMHDAYQRESKFIDIMWDKLGEQKIDIVINFLSLDAQDLPIYQVARTQGVKIV